MTRSYSSTFVSARCFCNCRDQPSRGSGAFPGYVLRVLPGASAPTGLGEVLVADLFYRRGIFQNFAAG
jgi:hypothetical protein